MKLKYRGDSAFGLGKICEILHPVLLVYGTSTSHIISKHQKGQRDFPAYRLHK